MMKLAISPQGVACRVADVVAPVSKYKFQIPRSQLVEWGITKASDPRWTFVVTTSAIEWLYLWDITGIPDWPTIDSNGCWKYTGYTVIDNRSEAAKTIRDMFGKIPWDQQIAEII